MQRGMVVAHDGAGWTIQPRDFPTDHGGLCRKGWTAATPLDAPDRLTAPVLRDRKCAPLCPAGWDE